MKYTLSTAISAVGALVATFLVIYWVLILPSLKEMVAARTALEQATAQTTVSTTKATTSDAETEAMIRQVNALMPETDQQYSLGVVMEDAARYAKVTLTSLTFAGLDVVGTPTAASTDGSTPVGAKRFTVSVAVRGSYTNIQAFVDRLTKVDRYLTLDQVSLAAGAAASTPGVTADLDGSIVAFAYYFPNVKPVAATPTPKPQSE